MVFTHSLALCLNPCILRFFEVSIKLVASVKSFLFSYSTESSMNSAVQGLLTAVIPLQPNLGSLEEYTVYSRRIDGLTAEQLIGASTEMINLCGDWAPYLQLNIIFRDRKSTL